MAGRLGHVLFWAGALIAALLVSAAFAFARNNPGEEFAAFVVGGFGVIVFLIGLASRHVLAGGSQDR